MCPLFLFWKVEGGSPKGVGTIVLKKSEHHPWTNISGTRSRDLNNVRMVGLRDLG